MHESRARARLAMFAIDILKCLNRLMMLGYKAAVGQRRIPRDELGAAFAHAGHATNFICNILKQIPSRLARLMAKLILSKCSR